VGAVDQHGELVGRAGESRQQEFNRAQFVDQGSRRRRRPGRFDVRQRPVRATPFEDLRLSTLVNGVQFKWKEMWSRGESPS
jgi:hypothetical protein